MDMTWTATDPDSRQLSSYRRTSADACITRIEALLATGEGYTAVHHASQLYPLLVGRAWTVVQDFLHHGTVEDLGEWREL